MENRSGSNNVNEADSSAASGDGDLGLLTVPLVDAKAINSS
tara:strand:- start:33 stop:155 length:123 start_codon:yes stop_codon:yes gene_type:complete